MTKKQKHSYNSKIAIACIIILLTYLVVGYTTASTPLTPKERQEVMKEHIKKTNPELLKKLDAVDYSTAVEQVGALIAKEHKMVRIKSHLEIKSKEDLMEYKNNRLALIDELSKEDKTRKVEAIINFNKLQTREEYLEFIKDHKNIELIEIRYRSTPSTISGVSSASNDQPLPSKESTEYQEKLISTNTNYKNYKHLTHIQTIRAKIKVKDLKKIQNDPRVFLVDVGPTNVKEIYDPNNEVQMLWRYIFPEIEKYGS